MTLDQLTRTGVLNLRRARRDPAATVPTGVAMGRHTYVSDAYRPEPGQATTALGHTAAADLLDRSLADTTRVINVFDRAKTAMEAVDEAAAPIFDQLAAELGFAPAAAALDQEGRKSDV